MCINVVIVNYKTPQLTQKCVASLLEHGVCDARSIVVVDNFSQDASEAIIRGAFPDITFIALKSNRGYSAGVNAGVDRCVHQYVVVLNPDTYFYDNPIPQVIDYLNKHERVGLVGLDLLNPDLTRQYPSRRFYTISDILIRRSPTLARMYPEILRKHLMTDFWENSHAFEADWVMGTGMVIRKASFEHIGKMDEGYFLYMEDVDLCARLWASGYAVVCIPGAAIVHDHQRSSARSMFGKSARMHFKSLIRYYRKFPLPLFATPSISKMKSKFIKSPLSV
ncbi:glycosyltransferase family 2 protein [Rhizobium sp. BK376]|uniref:glycosyltransferase family 2 protein n=1 Tax=Rhizobium sp. BK376 TaxID=2512149 RepID=UPI0010456C94|nr:glycosyltransferase family 2 protein [Rhizobium sp. BK376]TCR71859.1 hypothetical protein EV561_13141 [Rhizobium sp. BK376]